MKKFKFYALLMPLAIGLASFASCSSDDDSDNYRESVDVTSFDQVNFLQNNIVEVDSAGNFVQRVNGAKLNDEDSTELTVGVDSIGAAVEMFKSWLSPDTKVETVSLSPINIKADLKDGNGAVRETVYLKATTGGNNIAEMSFEKGGVLKHFSKVYFTAAYPPLTAFSPYAVGDCEQYETYNEGMRNWVCVKESQNGVAGLLVYLSSEKDRYGIIRSSNFASPSLAKAASDAMKKDWNTFVKYFKEAGQNLESGEYYWVNKLVYWVFGYGSYAIRLSDGDIDWFETKWKKPDKHYIQVRTFGLVQ